MPSRSLDNTIPGRFRTTIFHTTIFHTTIGRATVAGLLACLCASLAPDSLGGEIHRQILCSESGAFRLEPGPASCRYPKLAKTIKTQLFGTAVTISYRPVYSLSDDAARLYADMPGLDSSQETAEDSECRIRNIDVLFDFGKSGEFLFPLHIEDQHTPDTASQEYGTLVALTDVCDEFINHKATLLQGHDSSDSEPDTQQAADSLFGDVTIYSPFHPLALAVMRHFINNPREYRKVSRHLGRLNKLPDSRFDGKNPRRGTEPAIRRYNRMHLNLAFLLVDSRPGNAEACEYPEICAPDDILFEQGDSTDGDPHDGCLTLRYNTTPLIDANSITMVRSRNRSGEPVRYDYSINMEPLTLTDAGRRHIRSRADALLALPARERSGKEKGARPGVPAVVVSPAGSGRAHLAPPAASGAVKRADSIRPWDKDEVLPVPAGLLLAPPPKGP